MAAATQTAPDQTFQQEASTPETELKTKLPADPSDVARQDRDPQKVAQLAYSFWEARGCPNDSAEEDWFRAERELYGESSVTET